MNRVKELELKVMELEQKLESRKSQGLKTGGVSVGVNKLLDGVIMQKIFETNLKSEGSAVVVSTIVVECETVSKISASIVCGGIETSKQEFELMAGVNQIVLNGVVELSSGRNEVVEIKIEPADATIVNVVKSIDAVVYGDLSSGVELSVARVNVSEFNGTVAVGVTINGQCMVFKSVEGNYPEGMSEMLSYGEGVEICPVVTSLGSCMFFRLGTDGKVYCSDGANLNAEWVVASGVTAFSAIKCEEMALLMLVKNGKLFYKFAGVGVTASEVETSFGFMDVSDVYMLFSSTKKCMAVITALNGHNYLIETEPIMAFNSVVDCFNVKANVEYN